MAVTPRVYGGFSVLDSGMDGGRDASLIDMDQCANSCNLTFRSSFAKTRPPYSQIPLTFSDSGVQSNWTGRFQGACFYKAERGFSGFIVCVSGRLFRIQLGAQATVTEITPQVAISTSGQFTVPAVGNNVDIPVISDVPINNGDTIKVDSGTYFVYDKAADLLKTTYSGGGASAVVLTGTGVMNNAGLPIYETSGTDPDADLIDIFQAENQAIVLGGKFSTITYDGAISRVAGQDGIPPSTYGIYLWGRIWVALNDLRTFVAGDLVYTGGGTADVLSKGSRDSILKFTENLYLNEGGTFVVPNNAGDITGFGALSTQDTSLGVGPLLIGTTNSVISCNAPVDRATWKNLQYPIQTISLIDYGPTGPGTMMQVNGDLWYRALKGFRSFIVARRDINVWGNTPVSNEVDEILDMDSPELLRMGSGVFFDNKAIHTVSPYRTDNGIAHRGLIVINFDEISKLLNKTNPAWEGLNTGLQALKIVKGVMNGAERGFIFALNGTDIELWEIETDGVYDEGNSLNPTSINRKPIESFIESRRDSLGTPGVLKTLYTAELYVDEVVDDVTIQIQFRPDQYPAWVDWATIKLCADVSQCITPPSPGKFQCGMWKPRSPTYASRIMLPMPLETCNVLNQRPLNMGYEFQYKLNITGHCQIRIFRPHAKIQSDTTEGECPTLSPVCIPFENCEPNWFAYDSHLPPPPPIQT